MHPPISRTAIAQARTDVNLRLNVSGSSMQLPDSRFALFPAQACSVSRNETASAGRFHGNLHFPKGGCAGGQETKEAARHRPEDHQALPSKRARKSSNCNPGRG